MTSQLDALLSPDKLRQHWQSSLVPVSSPTQNIANLNIHQQYAELQRLITEKYPDTTPVANSLKELSEKINRVFEVESSAPAAEIADKEEIATLMEALEELLWSMELALSQGNK